MRLRSFAAFFLMVVVAFSVPAVSLGGGDEFDTRTKVGDRMPPVTVDGVDGRFSLAAEKGKVVVVNFWATWCGPCQEEMPELEKKVWQKYKGSPDFAFIGIAREQDRETVEKFQKGHPQYTFPLAWDPERAVYKQFAEGGIPRTYVVDRGGVIVYQSVGYGEGAVGEVERAVGKALGTAGVRGQGSGVRGRLVRAGLEGGVRIRRRDRVQKSFTGPQVRGTGGTRHESEVRRGDERDDF